LNIFTAKDEVKKCCTEWGTIPESGTGVVCPWHCIPPANRISVGFSWQQKPLYVHPADDSRRSHLA